MSDYLTRRFPIPVRPFHLETLESYGRRVLAINGEPADLAHRLGLVSRRTLDAVAWLEVLEAKTGRDLRRLIDPPRLRGHLDGAGCVRCSALIPNRAACTACARGDHVTQHGHFGVPVCLRHKRWIGMKDDASVACR